MEMMVCGAVGFEIRLEVRHSQIQTVTGLEAVGMHTLAVLVERSDLKLGWQTDLKLD